MKKILLLCLVVAMVLNVQAQNRRINFEQTKEWKKVLRKAKKAKKLIFVDCYTSWCGPCKTLDKKVFTQDTVADYFNETFINVKYDMEKDADGVILKSQFEIKAFPTLVFVDPETQQVVHRMVGAGSPDWLIAGAKKANDPQSSLVGMMKRYENGEKGSAFLADYLSVLGAAYMQKEREEVAMEYLNALPSDQLATKENWALIRDNISDPLSTPLKYVMNNPNKFYVLASEKLVNQKTESSIKMATRELSMWRPHAKSSFDEQRNLDMIQYLLSLDSDLAPIALANLYTAAYIRSGDFAGLLHKMKEVLSYNLFRKELEYNYFEENIEALSLCDDKVLVEQGIEWIDRMCGTASNYFKKASLMDVKAHLQLKIGDTVGAEKSKETEKKYEEEGRKRGGGAVRMMKMR